jgi:hypothetical protein
MLALASFGLLLGAREARADCADGWFCDDHAGKTRPPPPSAAPPPPDAPGPRPLTPAPPPPSPLIFPEPAEPDLAAEPPAEGAPAEPPAPNGELGVNVHFGVGLFGPGASDRAGLVGLGFAFRVRPMPLFAVDLGLEFMGGVDYNGNDRAEQMFTTNVVFFVNPGDPVQAFVFAGLGLGGAQARVEHLGGMAVPPHHASYAYFGGLGGLGVEWRFVESAALTGDFSLFARTRVDQSQYGEPEYVDPSSHLTTNGSGGGLFRLGSTFYF